MSRDMTRPNWKRTLNRLRKLAAELRTFDFQVIEPPNVDTPPSERYAQDGIVKGPIRVFDLNPGEKIVIVGESGPELLPPKFVGQKIIDDGPRRSGDHGLL